MLWEHSWLQALEIQDQIVYVVFGDIDWNTRIWIMVKHLI